MKSKFLEHPYGDLQDGTWLRGNLHAHTTNSDGARPTQEVIKDYQARGYGFLMISDHDVFTSTEQLAKFESGSMVLIPGNEISAHGNHILHVNAGKFIEPYPQRQMVLSEIAKDPESFSIVAHPNWQGYFDYTTVSQLREWVGYAGIEVYNGVIGRLDGSPYCTNKWDILLGQERRFWGYANDDSHAATGDVELGWNCVYVKNKSREEIVAALREGRFYPSTGVVIENITVDGMKIRVETKNADRIVAIKFGGTRFAQVDANVIEVEVPPDARYARFECWGRGEQMAWTQPFFVSEA